MAAAATSHVTVGPFVVNVMNRHPAVLARMASTLQIASGGRLILGIGIGGAPEGARGLRDRLPRGEGAGRPARGGDRRHPGALDRRPGDAALAVVSARGRPCVPGPDPAAADHHRRRDAGRGPAGGRIGDGWSTFEDNFEQNLPIYLEALEASGRRRADQRLRRVPGATGSPTPTSPRARGAASRAPSGSAGARSAPTGRSSSPGRPRTSTRSSRPRIAGSAGVAASPRRRRSAAGGRIDLRCRPRRPPLGLTHGCARCGAPGRRSTSGCASGATRSGCATRELPGPRHGVRRDRDWRDRAGGDRAAGGRRDRAVPGGRSPASSRR